MLELAAFVEVQKEETEKKNSRKKSREVLLYPVYIKDFTKDTIKKNRQGWLETWQDFKSKSEKEDKIEIDADKWKHALDVLLHSSGTSYDIIVNGVCRSLPHLNPLSDGNVQGMKCEITSKVTYTSWINNSKMY